MARAGCQVSLPGPADLVGRSDQQLNSLCCRAVAELKLKTGDVPIECASCARATTVNAEVAEAAIADGTRVLVEMEKAAPSLGERYSSNSGMITWADLYITLDAATIRTLTTHISTLSAPPVTLAPTSHPLLALRQSLLTHLIALQRFDTATATLAAGVLSSLQEVLPANHPARGVAAAVVVRLRGAGADGERNWSTAEGLRTTGVLARGALDELKGMGASGGAVRAEVEGVLRAVEEGLGRLGRAGA